MSAVAPLFGGAYANRRVFVTGHTGFKGSWLSEWLLDLDAQVAGYALDPPTEPSLFCELALEDRMTHTIGDVRDYDSLLAALTDFEPEFVFHLAAQPLVRLSYSEPRLTYDTNIMGTVNVLEAVRQCPSAKAVVVITSDKCYENRETGQSYSEQDPMGGFDPYSSSKGCAELVTAAYRQSFFGEGSSVSIATARAGNVIGGGDWALDRIVPDCIRSLEMGEPIVVRNPDAVRPWQHVLEPLAGYLHLAARMRSNADAYGGAWNFGPADTDSVPVRTVVDEIIAGWGSGAWTRVGQSMTQPHEAKLLALDINKARSLLGWAPLYSTERTLGVTSTWYAKRHTGGNVRSLVDEDIAAYAAEAIQRRAVWASEQNVQGSET